MAHGTLFLFWKSSVALCLMLFITQNKGLYTAFFSNRLYDFSIQLNITATNICSIIHKWLWLKYKNAYNWKGCMNCWLCHCKLWNKWCNDIFGSISWSSFSLELGPLHLKFHGLNIQSIALYCYNDSYVTRIGWVDWN